MRFDELTIYKIKYEFSNFYIIEKESIRKETTTN